jgi:hypothetical protein
MISLKHGFISHGFSHEPASKVGFFLASANSSFASKIDMKKHAKISAKVYVRFLQISC